jgi:FlaA1/EpsC-like NDP-sugar epimerase
MKKPLVIFGTGDIAQLAHYYFSHDSDYEVVAFTVDAAYVTEDTFCGLPVLAFDRIAEVYPPSSHECFVAISYARLNAVRRDNTQ